MTGQRPFLPISAWYTGGRTRATMVRPPEPDAEESWRRDVQAIRDSGFNSVRCWVDWASAEAEPGTYRFEALDLLTRLAREVGIRVVVQVYLDSAPDWLGVRFPNSRYVSASGVAIDSQGSPGYCYDHPGVRDAAEVFLTALAERLAGEPSFYGWDLWSEPHIVQWSYFDYLQEPALFCYCPNTLARFRGWLQRRYGDLASLNAAWYRQFADWEEVQPPRFITLMTYTDFIDWLQFLMDKLAEDLRWRHDVVRRVDDHVTSSHSAVPSVLTLPTSGHGSPDDWRMPASVDVWGTSLYPKHLGARETADPSFRSAMLACTRSACDGAPYWLGELQGGHGYVGTFAAEVTADDVRSYAWQCLAHGAKGLHFYAWYPMTSGIESAGFGLAELDGTPSGRALAAGEVARIVDRHAELFEGAAPAAAEAAICWDVYANIMWAAMRETAHYVPSRSYVGAYRALYRERLPGDFVHADGIAAGKLTRYRLLFLPFAFMLPREAARAIDAFVADGGIAFAEARTAWNDETGYCDVAVPGFGLERVFGCRERGAERVDEGAAVPIRIVREHPALPLLRPGDIVNGAVFREALEPVSPEAEVVGEFEDGSPAIVAHRYGEGWTVFAGTLLSLAYYRSDDEGAGKLLRGVARAAGLEPAVRTGGVASLANVESHVLDSRTADGRPVRILVGLNHGSEPAEATFVVDAPDGCREVVDLATGEPVAHELKGGRLTLTKKLGAAEVCVVAAKRG